jgi:hypothetical protein
VPLTPLELPGWLEFNVWRTGLKVHRFSTTSDDTPGDAPGASAVFYLDRRGRVRLPPNNPYLSVTFRSDRRSPSGRTADWLRVAGPLAEEMKQRGVANQLYLPPDIDDVRPWIWRGFFVGVRYTYYLDFPFDATRMGQSARRDSLIAVKAGMTVERVTDVDPVLECLAAAEARQGFSHHMGSSELRAALSCMGEGSMRMYVCFDSQGRPASSQVMLHSPGARAIHWMGGTMAASLLRGSAYAGLRFAFDDLASAGATGLDLCGANAESIAAFKSHLGGRLVPNYGVRTYAVRTAGRFAVDWIGSRRAAPGG